MMTGLYARRVRIGDARYRLRLKRGPQFRRQVDAFLQIAKGEAVAGPGCEPLAVLLFSVSRFSSSANSTTAISDSIPNVSCGLARLLTEMSYVRLPFSPFFPLTKEPHLLDSGLSKTCGDTAPECSVPAPDVSQENCPM